MLEFLRSPEMFSRISDRETKTHNLENPQNVAQNHQIVDPDLQIPNGAATLLYGC